MKKITLSAAILALAMMGCSDAGLDNSVASTNEVKNEPAFLAKSDNWPIKSYTKQEDLQPVGSDGRIHFGYHEGVGIQIDVETYIENGANNAIGKFTMQQGLDNPDLIRIITLPLYNCNPSGQTVGCRLNGHNSSAIEDNFLVVRTNTEHVKSFQVSSNSELEFHPNNGFSADKMNVITYYIAVWKPGQWNQVTLAGTIYNGKQFQSQSGKRNKLAEKAYERYFLPALTDWMAKHPNG